MRSAAVEAECLLAGAGDQTDTYVADDIGRKIVQVMPADLAAFAWFGVDGLAIPPLGGEEDADAGVAVRVGVMA